VITVITVFSIHDCVSHSGVAEIRKIIIVTIVGHQLVEQPSRYVYSAMAKQLREFTRVTRANVNEKCKCKIKQFSATANIERKRDVERRYVVQLCGGTISVQLERLATWIPLSG